MTAGALTAIVVGVVVAVAVASGGGDDGSGADPTVTTTTALPPVDTGVRLPESDDGGGGGTDDGPPQGQGAGAVDLADDELPTGWPDDFPLPPDGDVDLGSSTTVDGARVLGVTVLLDEGDPSEVIDGYLDALDVDGYTVLRDDVVGSGVAESGTLTFETKQYVGDVLATPTPDGGVTVTLTATFPD